MYIRRKVFSKLQNEAGEERYYSTTEFTRVEEGEEIKYFSKCCDCKESDDDKKKSAKKTVIKKGKK